MSLVKKIVLFNLIALSIGNQLLQAATHQTTANGSQIRNHYNISVNPIWLPLGVIDGEIDFAVSERLTLGAYTSIFQYRIGTTNISSLGLGARLNYYLTQERLSTSWYISPFAQIIPTAWTASAGNLNYTSFSFGGIFGRHWVFKSGFNIMAGAGLSYYTAKNSMHIHGQNVTSNFQFSGFWPTGEFRLGYTF
jgi:hypothetical protein